MSTGGAGPGAARAAARSVTAAAALLVFLLDVRLGIAAVLVLVALAPPAVPWRPLAAAAVLRAYLPFAVAWYGLTFAYLRLLHALGHPVPPQPVLVELACHGTAMPGFLPILLVVVVVAPLVEEVLFRGYLLTALLAVLPGAAAHGATALLFGVVHGLDYALPVGVLALLFGWLRHRQGSLLAPCAAHVLHNGLTVTLTLAWPEHLAVLYPR